MATHVDIKNQLLLDYLKREKYLSYWDKFNIAQHLLKKKPAYLLQIKNLRAKLENKCMGINLLELQGYYEQTDDLNSFIMLGRGSGLKLKMKEVKNYLNEFKVNLDDIVFEAFEVDEMGLE